jgi:hypothetical protein
MATKPTYTAYVVTDKGKRPAGMKSEIPGCIRTAAALTWSSMQASAYPVGSYAGNARPGKKNS